MQIICYPDHDFPSDLLDWITKTGAFIYEPNDDERNRLESILGKITGLLSDVIGENPIYLYCYDNNRSIGSFSSPDGMWSYVGNLQAIGIGTKAFAIADNNYLSFLLLHEIAHMILGSGEHNAEFEQYLNYLLIKYNEAYGTELVNDYSGYSEAEI